MNRTTIKLYLAQEVSNGLLGTVGVDTPKRHTFEQHFNQSERYLNLPTLSKDKSQIGWRSIHPWWTNQWPGLHWSSEADSEPGIAFWRSPKGL